MNQSNHHCSQEFHIGGPKAAAVLIICSLLWAINFMDRQLFAVVLEPMRHDLGLTDSQAGWITTALLLGLALFAIPAAHWSDRWSRKKAIAMMAILWSVATGLTGLGYNAGSVFILRLLTGAGQAGFSAAAMALISASYPERIRGKTLGFFNLFQIVGIFVGLVLGGYLSSQWGSWRTPFHLFALPGIVLGISAFFMQDEASLWIYPSDGKKISFYRNISTLVKIPTIVWFYAGYTCFTAVGFSILAWIPALLMRRFEIDESIAGFIMAGASVFTVPGAILGGILADRWQARHPAGRMRFAAIMTLICSMGIILSNGSLFILHTGGINKIDFWLITGAGMLSLFCACSAAVNPAVMAATQTVVPQHLKGLVWGLGLTIMLACGGAWAPAATGYFSDRLGGDATALACALLLISLPGFAGSFFLWKAAGHYPSDIQMVNICK